MHRIVRAFSAAAVVLMGMASAQAADPEFRLRFASYAPEGDVFDQAAQHFAQRVAELTDGRVEVTVFGNNSLGSNREVIEMAKVGSVDFFIAGSTHVSRYAPVLLSISFPYMFKDPETMFRILDGDVGAQLHQLVAGQGLEILGWWESGFRHVTNNQRPIVNPEDIQGLKLRTLPSPVHVAFFQKLGAIPTPMDWAEVMPALQQGVIDGQENPPSVVYPYRVFEFQKYYSLTGHSNDPTMFVMSGLTMARLPADLQDAIRQAAQETTAFERQIADEYNAEIMGKLSEVIEINEVPAATIASFQEAARSVYEEAYAELGEEGRALVDEIVNASQ
ncbi:MAG: TRAP transporter substrate-binding protein [Geminicoccaceae bacterium]